MRWNGGVLAGLLIGVAWLVAGAVLVAVGRRRRARSTLEGADSAAVIGIFILVVGALTLFATLLLAVVPGAP